MIFTGNYLYSYCDRVKENYNKMKNTKYNVTMLLCSFIGVMAVIDKKKERKIFNDVTIPSNLRKKMKFASGASGIRNVTILHHLRNSLCHLKIDEDYIKEESKQITQIQLKDKKKFECTLTVEELEQFFYFIIEAIQNKTKIKKKSSIEKILSIALGLLICLSSNAHAVPLTAEHLYTFARQKKEKLLDKYSKHIDITNKNNDTALCLSVKQRDRDSFELLKDYGASTKVECLQKMLKKSVVKQDNTSAVVSDSDGEFLGMGLKGWGITGLAVAGIATASSGGGGSSSGSNEADDKEEIILNCQNGTQVGDKCECYFGYEGELCDALKVGYEENGRGEIVCSSGYGKNGTEECVKKNNPLLKKIWDDSAIDSFSFMNEEFRDVYGIYAVLNTPNIAIINVTDNKYQHQYKTIKITNYSNGDVYGVYSNQSVYNRGSIIPDRKVNDSTINIVNIGQGNVYGIYSPYQITNVDALTNATGHIIIQNTGNGNIFGLYSNSSIHNAESQAHGDNKAHGDIYITNNGLGSAFGMFGSYVYNEKKIGAYESYISMVNENKGYSTGIYGMSTALNSGDITIVNASSGLVFGVTGNSEVKNSGKIKIHNLDEGIAIGLYGNNALVNNTGSIDINRKSYSVLEAISHVECGVNGVICGDVYKRYNPKSEIGGMAIGIYGTNNSKITNKGSIKINNVAEGIGIYGASGSNITNSGTITISGADTSYGIYAEDDTVTVSNTGTISIDGDTNHANAIKLNGGKFFQDGELIAQNIALNDFGGEIIANSNSKFVAEDKISGDLSVSADITKQGFDKVYTSKGIVEAKDISELNLASKSALFDAKLDNNSDVVMEMKEFEEVVDDKSVANFLRDNYSNQNNEKLFNNLKGIENTKALNSALSDITGKEMFNRLAFEDLTMAREFNFDLNSKLFNNKEKNLTTSGSISPWMFSGASDSQTRYSLNNMTIGSNTIGLAVALTDVNTNDGNGKNTRNDKMYQMAMPIGYSAYGFDFITTPSVGYSYGTYNRLGYNNTNYKGTLEKQTFGLMNEARYPFMMAGWNLDFALEFNVMGYRISGDEGSKEFGLNIAKQDSFSVEAGFGMYANKDIDISKDSKLKLYNGVALYHEFADPYKMRIGMNGMSGTYTLRDNDRSKNRAVVRTGFDYTSQDLSLYGSLSSYIDHELQTNADIGLKYNF